MRLPSQQNRTPIGVNMTPLIDVVFLLFMFFLVASHLMQRESHLPLMLPTVASGPVVAEDLRPRITVSVTPEGKILLGGGAVEPAQLQRRLKQELAKFRTQFPQRDDLEIRIRSARSVPYQRVEPVLLACARAGIWNVTFAVQRRNEKAEPLEGSRAGDTSRAVSTQVF